MGLCAILKHCFLMEETMVNRTMQAKRLKATKQKRMKRAYLKEYFGLIKVPQSVDKSKVPLNAEGIFDYRYRGNTPAYDPYLDAIFPGVKQLSPEKQRCMRMANSERVIAMLASPADSFVTVREGGITKTRTTMMYNSDYSHCYFTETCTHPTNSYIKKSMVYGSRERAYFALEHKIVWLERIELASDQPDSPSG